MSNYFAKFKVFIFAHKITSVILLVVVAYVGYWGYGKITSTAGDTRYVSAKVERGNIVASISGTGQVSDINQIDLKPKVSGDVVYLGAVNGAKVSAGTLILEIDPRDAQKAVRDAETNLESAKLSLQKLQIQNSEQNLSADLLKAYGDAFDAVSKAFLDLSPVNTGLLDAFNFIEINAKNKSDLSQTYMERANVAYYKAKKAFEDTRKKYRTLTIDSPKTDIENIIKETSDATLLLSDATKSILDLVGSVTDNTDSSIFASTQATLATYNTTISADVSTLYNASKDIADNKDTTQNASLDIQSAELSVTQRANALQDAKEKLADYFVRAPYAGVVANLDIKKGDTASSSTAVASIVTTKQLALLSLNEIDISRIKLGQKATITFDAVPDLAMSGVVTEIDPIGTVSQGVVTYDVKVSFDTQDDRIKPGMSVTTAIITDMKQDVLMVPNSAVKSQNGSSYVEVFDPPLPPSTDGLPGSISKIHPKRIRVQIGVANDSHTEIISGLSEGEEIVVRTILPSSTTTTAAPSLFGGGARATGATGGGNRTGGGLGR